MMATTGTAANRGALTVASVIEDVAAKANGKWRVHDGNTLSVERAVQDFREKKEQRRNESNRVLPEMGKVYPPISQQKGYMGHPLGYR
jgi:hypothetical protein